jgi:hypothetical protein
MKKHVLFVLTAAVLLTSIACKRRTEEGHGKETTKTYDVSGFTSVDIGAPVDVDLTVSNVSKPTVTIHGYENLLDKITCKVENGVLKIEKDGIFTLFTDKDIKATITMPAINGLTIRGASEAKLHGNITGDSFLLNIKGAGDVEMDELNMNSFVTKVSGAGDLKITKGAVNNAEFRVTGAGDVDAFGLQVKKLTAELSGAGDIDVSVSEVLDANINGAGSVNYKGNPSVTSDINGIGSLERVN